jgi:hypothetical protein
MPGKGKMMMMWNKCFGKPSMDGDYSWAYRGHTNGNQASATIIPLHLFILHFQKSH